MDRVQQIAEIINDGIRNTDWELASEGWKRTCVNTAQMIEEAVEFNEDYARALTALHEIKQWVDAYPTTVFTPLNEADIDDIRTTIGTSAMAKLHAGWARHIMAGLSRILVKALVKGNED